VNRNDPDFKALQINADHRKFEQSQVLSDHCLRLDEQSHAHCLYFVIAGSGKEREVRQIED
jgi:hypothetical protein